MNITLVMERLTHLRQTIGYTQQALADKMGVSVTSVKNWESGNCLPSTENMDALADLYNVTTDYLYGRECKNIINLPNNMLPNDFLCISQIAQTYIDFHTFK